MSEMQFNAEVVQNPELGTDVIRLQHEDPDPSRSLLAEVAPGLGSNLYRYKVGGHEVFYSKADLLKTRDWTGNFVLWPFPNRIRNKKYEFDGMERSLKHIKRNEGNYPLIHGLVDDKEWDFTQPAADENSARASTSIEINPSPESPLYRDFPFPSKLTIDYILHRGGIRTEYTVENTGSGPMGFGFAQHPYFRLLSGTDKTLVTVPANYVFEADEELLPTGRLIPTEDLAYDLRKPTPVEQLDVDDVYTDLVPGGETSIDYTTRGLKIILNCSDDVRNRVLFTKRAGLGFICLEGQTCSTDTHNMHAEAERAQDERLKRAANLIILRADGEPHKGYIEYAAQFYDPAD